MTQNSRLSSRLTVTLDGLGACGLVLWILSPIVNTITDGHPNLHAPDVRRTAIVLFALAFIVRTIFKVETKYWSEILRWFRHRGTTRAICLIGASVGLLIALTWTYAFRFTLYDVGLFHQVLWSLRNGHGFLSTVSGSGNHLADHFSPTLATLMPFFALTGGAAWTLPVLQWALIIAGVSAWLFLGKRLFSSEDTLDRDCLATIVVSIVSMNSLWGNLAWGLHETAIAFAGFSWAFALLVYPQSHKNERKFVERYRWWIAPLAFVVGALSKETCLADAAVFCFSLGFVYMRRGRRIWLPLFALGALLIGIFGWFELQPKPADKNYFARDYGYLGNNLSEFLVHIFTKPQDIITTIGVNSLTKFFLTLLLPFCGLPVLLFLGKRTKVGGHSDLSTLGVILGSILPSVTAIALSIKPQVRDGTSHYAMGLWPAIAVTSFVALHNLRHQWRPAQVRWFLFLWVFVVQMFLERDPVFLTQLAIRDLSRVWQSQAVFSLIKDSDSVSADERVGPWLSNRGMLTRWPELELFGDKCPDWIVLHRDRKENLQWHHCGVSAEEVTGNPGGIWILWSRPQSQKTTPAPPEN